MDREKIPFGEVTIDTLAELQAQADVRIASQKFAYLKAKGGVKLPSDLNWLNDVCWQVYVRERPLLGGNPTDAELKQLLSPSVTKVPLCNWKD